MSHFFEKIKALADAENREFDGHLDVDQKSGILDEVAEDQRCAASWFSKVAVVAHSGGENSSPLFCSQLLVWEREKHLKGKQY